MYPVLACVGVLAFANGYVNVALKKPASQHDPWPGKDIYDASNAVDGRKSDLSVNGGQCAVSFDYGQTAIWWVNLTSIYSIHHITIYFMTNNESWGFYYGFTNNFLGFSVYVSNTTDKSQGTLCYKDDNFTLDTIPAVFTTTCPVLGQYVIYYNERLPGVTYPDYYSDSVLIALCEVEVYGCPATGCYGSNNTLPCPDVNCQYCHLETGACQSCKPGYQGYRCELACEKGSYESECNETCGHCLDVNQCSNINGTCLTGCDAGYQGDLCISPCDRGLYGSECSETCGHCRDVNQCSNFNGTCLTGCDAGYQGELCKTPCPVGYFGEDCSETCINSYTCDGCNEVGGTCNYGCRPGWIGYFCQKINVALNKPAYLQYPYRPGDDTWGASKAVDGRKSDLSPGGGQCAVSGSGQTATLWVNLTTIHSIHHITIYFRTENKPWGPSDLLTKYFLGFSVYVSNTTDRLPGTLCYKDDNFTLDTIPSVFTTTCPVHGHYVIYYNERLPSVSYPDKYSDSVASALCEVEVYGCPSTGCYGSNNILPCPDVNCQYCHIETGTCHGCKPGYQDYRCELACDKGKYGSECSKTCGHCRDVKQCSNINGTCLTGCDPDYQGDLCKTRN